MLAKLNKNNENLMKNNFFQDKFPLTLLKVDIIILIQLYFAKKYSKYI